MGFSNENMTWFFFSVFRTTAIRFVLNCGLFQEFLGLLQFLVDFSIAEGGQSSQRSNILAGFRWPTVERKSFLAYFSQEDKPRNGDSLDITFVLLIGLIMKTYLCYHLCPKSGLNYLRL